MAAKQVHLLVRGQIPCGAPPVTFPDETARLYDVHNVTCGECKRQVFTETKEGVSTGIDTTVNSFEEPYKALEFIRFTEHGGHRDPLTVCAIIDSLNPVTAAMMIMGLKLLRDTGKDAFFIINVLNLARELNIKGLRGLNSALGEIGLT